MSNVIDLLYLNPKIHVEENLTTFASASNFFYSSASTSNLNIINGILPRGFNYNVYLAGIGNTLELGSLNKSIYESMILDGYSSNNIIKNGEYVTSINKNIYLTSPNVFTTGSNFYLSDFGIDSSNRIYILKDYGEKFYVKVEEVFNDTTFRISHYSEFKNMDSDYRLMGMLLYDPVRLATIKYLTYSNDTPIISIDPAFNPDLYRILYPQTKSYTNETLYIDYLTSSSNNIGKTYEMGANNVTCNVNNIVENFTILNTLKLNFANLNGYLQWDNLRIHGISQNSFTDSSNLDPNYNYFITESATKRYVDNNVDNARSYAFDITSNSASNYINVNGKGKINDYLEVGDQSTTIDSTGSLYSKNTLFDSLFKILDSFENISITLTRNIIGDIFVLLPSSFSYILNEYMYIMVEYQDYKNIFKISSKSISNNILALGCESNGINMNIPFDVNIIVNVYVVHNLSEKIKTIDKRLFTIQENSGNYILDHTFSNNKSVAITDNIVVNKSTFCHFLTRTDNSSDNEFRSYSSNVINTSNNFVLHETYFNMYAVKINSYQVLNETTLVLTIVYPKDPHNTYSLFYDFNLITLTGFTWKILDIFNLNQVTGSIDIKISTFDNSEVAYDSILFGYLLLDITMLTTIEDTYVNVFKVENMNLPFYNDVLANKKDIISISGVNNDRDGYLAFFDNKVYIDNKLICSNSNISIQAPELSILGNRFNIKVLGENVLMENNVSSGLLYLGSSNAFIDRYGNMQLRGQVIAPEFSRDLSSNNILIDLQNRVRILEEIISKYNLYL